MEFEETIGAIEAFQGHVVEASIWGREDDRSEDLATLTGTLRRLPSLDLEELESEFMPSESLDVLRESIAATIFTVGEHDLPNHLTLWPHRFLWGERMDEVDGIRIVTKDGVIAIERHRPWVD